MTGSFLKRNASVPVVLGLLLLGTLTVTMMAASGGLSTSFVKTLGMTLCLALAALAMDLVWGYAGILSLGNIAFFALGGYMIGMWLMTARTEGIVAESLSGSVIPPTPQEIRDAVGGQIFGVVGSTEFPAIWAFSGSLPAQLALVVLVPSALALVFGWLAFRSRVTGVYLSILTQAMTLALALYLFQNDAGLRGNNGLSGLQNLPGQGSVPQSTVSMWFLWGSSVALALGYLLCAWVVSGKFGAILRGIRDNEARVRFLGYPVEGYKLAVFTLSAAITGIAGALYYPQAGIVNPAEMMPIASIYLAVWVAIGGRGRLYGAVIGAIVVSLVSSFFTSGQLPDLALGPLRLVWVDWWLVILGLSFVLVTLLAPRGLGGLVDLWTRRRRPARHGADLGPDTGSFREEEAKA